MSPDRPRVAILGGGMAGLTTAWRLTDPEVRHRVGEVTVYQRGFRLGGKGASSRGRHGRIEEHGLHIWLGYYDNAFRVMRECYGELDRDGQGSTAPIKTWTDAFAPAPHIGLDDQSGGTWQTWTAAFSTNDRLPGEPVEDTPAMTLAEMAVRSVRLVLDFYRSLPWDSAPPPRLFATTAITGALTLVSNVEAELKRFTPQVTALTPLTQLLDEIRQSLEPLIAHHPPAQRLWQLLDVVAAQIKGLVRDDLLRRGFRSIDHLDYRAWIASHGASAATLDSALIRGLYNLAFSHRGGDPRDTAFPAGLGLFLSMKTFFDFKGSIFWKMQAGMGDVVMAPLYEALTKRGVKFEFFHRVDQLHLSHDSRRLEAVSMGRQVALADHDAGYRPLQDYDGLPCFPSAVDLSQVEAGSEINEHNLESFWCQWPDVERRRLVRGTDFDEVVLAIPVGMTKHLATELIAADERWRDMCSTMATVGTQAFQLWLTEDEASLGWPSTGSTVTNYVDSYDTWASMSYLLDVERSPLVPPPATLAYFCSSAAVEDNDDPEDEGQLERARTRAREEAIQYLESDIGHYWPGALDEHGRFRWSLLAGSDADDRSAFDSQFVTANIDPSDQYVQAVPEASYVRLRPDDSGFDGLHLAGDWTDCGLNAGCIEAAVLSGVGAANSVLGLPRGARITGSYLL